MVTTAWRRFHEHRDNGLTSDVFKDQTLMNRLKGGRRCRCINFGATCCCCTCRLSGQDCLSHPYLTMSRAKSLVLSIVTGHSHGDWTVCFN